MLEALTKWYDELTGGRQFTVVTDHQALIYFKAKKHTAGRHIQWQNFFHGFKCDILYVEGHKNKVADALSQYYESSTVDDLHYDDYVSADIRIDKNGEDLPLSRLEEAEEMLHFHHLGLESLRLNASRKTPNRPKSKLKGAKSKANVHVDPKSPLGRSEPTLADIVVPETNLRTSLSNDAFMNAVKAGYSKHAAWHSILDSPQNFPNFKVNSGLIIKVNDLGEQCLVLPV